MAQYSSRVIRIEAVRSWPVAVGIGVINQLDQYLDFSRYSSIVLITDTNVKRLYGQNVLKALKTYSKKTCVFSLPVGERAKSLGIVDRAYMFLLQKNIDRKGLICTLGGGVVGDLGGYVAATYLRGLDYIQLPTTLLAQVDSSIGGKTGVNFVGKKNMIGSFYQPKAIISDIAFLKSLPQAEMHNGLGEVMKYGLALDEDLFGILEQRGKGDFVDTELSEIVKRCADLKANIIEVDELERSGERAILNFGHTVGHALETVNMLQRYRHGEAVAIGMIAAVRISEKVGMLDVSSIHRVERVLRQLGLPTRCQGTEPDDLVKAISFDKKTTSGQTGWVLLNGIGKGVVNQRVPVNLVKEVLKEICR
ncbi:MAG: 3-dehydroquinate synthase [Chloroflexi bacterium RBG_13_52_14]|nr:MAG: 3-dehydroquinate synthase [Chloroflexi bacterium RBG_13_52_14]